MSINFAIKTAKADVAASQTDSVVIPAVTNKRIRVHAVTAKAGGTATTVVFNTKPAGAGSAVTCVFANGANGDTTLPYSQAQWFQTGLGEGLSVTTGAGSSTGIQVLYSED